jgi:hypothetical protein
VTCGAAGGIRENALGRSQVARYASRRSLRARSRQETIPHGSRAHVAMSTAFGVANLARFEVVTQEQVQRGNQAAHGRTA